MSIAYRPQSPPYTRGWRRGQGPWAGWTSRGLMMYRCRWRMLSHLVRLLSDDITCATNSSVWLCVIAFRFVVHPAPYRHPRAVLMRQKYCSLVAQPGTTLDEPLRQNLIFTVEGTSTPSTARNPTSIEVFPRNSVHLYDKSYRCTSSRCLYSHLRFQVREKYTDTCHTIQKSLGTNPLFAMGTMLAF